MKTTSKYEDDLKNADDLKNEDDPKIQDDLRNQDGLKNADLSFLLFLQGLSIEALFFIPLLNLAKNALWD